MAHLKRVIHEVHRRSLWQVLGIYLAGSWVALQVVATVTDTAGLPDWTPGMAFVILLILLPVVMATAFVQEGMPGAREAQEAVTDEGGGGTRSAADVDDRDGLHHRVFRWRTVLFGAMGAFTLLGLSIFAYFVMWSSGIGPVGNLQAQGVITEGEPVILAELENRTDDPELGAVLTGALRTDLEQSGAISIVSGAALEGALVRMGRDPAETVTTAVAREIAVRQGIAAVIEGEVGSVGPSFVLTVRIVSADDGAALASFRETADGEGDLLEALDRLSRTVRERVGESLRTINRRPPLLEATTPSLEALRKYTEATSAATLDRARGTRLLEEAVALDTAFAMAWRKLSSWYETAGRLAESRDAAEKAYRFVDRLPRVERDLVTAQYLENFQGDIAGAIQVYQTVLAYAPTTFPAANNLNVLLRQQGRFQEAVDVLQPFTERGERWGLAYTNTAAAQVALGDYQGASRALDLMVDMAGFPVSTTFNARARVSAVTGSRDEAHAWADSLEANGSVGSADYYRWAADVRSGRLREAVEHVAERADRSARSDHPGWAVWDRSAIAATVVQTDTAGALRLLAVAHAEAETGAPDDVHYGMLAWAWYQAGDASRVKAVRALAEARASTSEWAGGFLPYLRFLESVSAGAFDLAAYEAAEEDCAFCQRPERAEMSYEAGRLEDAAAFYEHIFRIPGGDFGHLWAPLYHERVAAIYEELGDKAKAAQHYRAFADTWKDADPELQPRVRQAREKAAALGG